MMAAQESRQPQERICALVAEKEGRQIDLYFSVRSCPITIDGKGYLLFFMQDVTAQQNKACLDGSFFHDINNILCGLACKSEILSIYTRPLDHKVKELHNIILRIVQEVAIHDSLRKSLGSSYKPLYSRDCVNSALREIDELFCDHPLTAARKVEVAYAPDEIMLTTDFSLVNRIVTNMTINALEATPDGGTVQLSVERQEKWVSFRVWNAGKIPDGVARRIFQRNFSTKSSMGRGLGTYSMKLFGEQLLGGRVTFDSSEASGTTFSLTLAGK